MVSYFILVNTSTERYDLTYDPDVSGDILTALTPNTKYEFRQVIFNGAFNITSLPAVTQTLDGGRCQRSNNRSLYEQWRRMSLIYNYYSWIIATFKMYEFSNEKPMVVDIIHILIMVENG